jgi:3-hydroxyisobutyrate dehydrogenase-like beta-hydroxyacid dehydrogenase
MAKTIIGFVGLGIMGKPMARHLLNAGYSLVGKTWGSGKT